MKNFVKIIAFVFTVILTVSCSKDDEDSYVIPAEKRYLSSVTDQDGKTLLKVEYYDNKKFKKFIFSGDGEFRYIYDNSGRVSSSFASTYECQYTYDANGRIASYMTGGQTYPVLYNAAENSYAFNILGSSNTSVKVFLDKDGNCTKMMLSNSFTYNFFYEDNRLGPLSNGGNMSLTNFISFLPMFVIDYGQANLNTLAVPLEDYFVTGINNGSMSTTYDNKYDSENFLINSTKTYTTKDENGNTNTTVAQYTYHYIEL